MSRRACYDGDHYLVLVPPARRPDSPLLVGVIVASALVVAGLLVNVGRALLA